MRNRELPVVGALSNHEGKEAGSVGYYIVKILFSRAIW